MRNTLCYMVLDVSKLYPRERAANPPIGHSPLKMQKGATNPRSLVELGGFDCYKFDYSGFFDRRQNVCKLLIILVGAEGFEPPTLCSQIRSHALLESIEICGFQVFHNEWVAASSIPAVVFCGFWMLWLLQI